MHGHLDLPLRSFELGFSGKENRGVLQVEADNFGINTLLVQLETEGLVEMRNPSAQGVSRAYNDYPSDFSHSAKLGKVGISLTAAPALYPLFIGNNENEAARPCPRDIRDLLGERS